MLGTEERSFTGELNMDECSALNSFQCNTYFLSPSFPFTLSFPSSPFSSLYPSPSLPSFSLFPPPLPSLPLPSFSSSSFPSPSHRLAELMDEHKEELATLESVDSGAVYTLALKTHVGFSIDTFRYFAGWCDKIQGTTIPINNARPSANLCFTKKEPIG